MAVKTVCMAHFFKCFICSHTHFSLCGLPILAREIHYQAESFSGHITIFGLQRLLLLVCAIIFYVCHNGMAIKKKTPKCMIHFYKCFMYSLSSEEAAKQKLVPFSLCFMLAVESVLKWWPVIDISVKAFVFLEGMHTWCSFSHQLCVVLWFDFFSMTALV